MRNHARVIAAFTGLALSLAATQTAGAQSAADRAVEAAKQYAGITLNITFEAGLQALDPLNFSGPLWEELTGIKINVAELPLDEMFTKALIEHRAGTGAYDVINVVPAWMADMVTAGVVEPLDPFIDKYGIRSDLDDIADTYRENWMTWGGTIYGLPDDGDVFVLYYRKDLFEDSENMAEFKAKHGYELAPPTTWEQFTQISQFFTDKFAPELYGSGAMHGIPHVHYFFQERFRVAGGKFFDPQTMKATINSEIGVQALTDMIAMSKSMPPGVEAWGFGENLTAFLAGETAMWESWPPVGRWAEGIGADLEALSWLPKTQIAGKVGYALPPGGTPQLAAGFSLAVSSDSKHKDAAYLFIQWLNSKEISIQRVRLAAGLRDPYRVSHYESPESRSAWPTAGEYLDTLRLGSETGILDLSIKSTAKYEDALARAVSAAFGGEDPKSALDGLAAQWDEFTEIVGVDSQREAYEVWASKPNAYP